MELPELINAIKRIKSGNHFKNYIDFIQFPYYRNLEINTRINFDFPLTVFIGQNGCGKSSALHSLYGTVYGKTPYEFWFDTQVDPIQYYDDEKRRHSFWYSYKDDHGVIKEVVKARIRRANDPNYWETSRPLIWADMKKKVKSDKRDKPIRKEIIYLDFRSELSAFDKFFYFGDIKNSSVRNKQEFIRNQSRSLNKIFTGEKTVINSSKRKLNSPLKNLSEEELENISFILGRKYFGGKYVKHSIFRNEGYSVLFQTGFAKYSEAFAGSGEMAVVRLVIEVLNAPEFSLILLDEPEVSLHPGAQVRLKEFLIDQIIKKKHQIVLASHSPSLIKGLPKEAVKVFYQNPNNGRFLVKENVLPQEAFYYIEHPIDDRKNITVEDILAKEIIDSVLDKMGTETKNLFHVKFNPGGESVIKKEFISVFCRDVTHKDYIFFDGDQRSEHFDWTQIPIGEITISKLQQKIKEQTKETIKFSVDSEEGGGNKAQQLELLKKYADYYKSNVFYLPGQIPEDIIWNDEKAAQLIKIRISDENRIQALLQELNGSATSKEKFSKLSMIVYDKSNAEDIASVHKLFLKSWIDQQNEDFVNIRDVINIIKERG